MRYKVGQIVFFKGKGIYGKFIELYNLINYGEKGYTHVGIITKVLKDTVIIHEAIYDGFTSSHYDKLYLYKEVNNGTIKILNSKIKLTNVYKNAEKYLGRPYAWLDIFGILLSFIFKFKFLKLTGANKLICSEAVSRILYDSSNKKINLSSEYNKPYDLITPMDIYNSKWLR